MTYGILFTLIIIKKILEHKLGFILTFTISVVLSSIYITSFPRYYSTDTQLAPEINNSAESGGLSSIASSFGLDMGKINTLDAITPLLYPELMKDNIHFAFNQGQTEACLSQKRNTQTERLKKNCHLT